MDQNTSPFYCQNHENLHLAKATETCHKTQGFSCCVEKERTNAGLLVAVATAFCVVAPSIFGTSVWNLLHVTVLTSTCSFGKICVTLPYTATVRRNYSVLITTNV